MYFLAIDSATNSGGVALGRNSEVIGLCLLKTPLSYSERLLHTVEFLLDQFDLTLGDIDCFVTAEGPGSFTGLRIGLATVKGLGQSLERSVIGIPTLEALAWRYRLHGRRVSAMVDARRQQVFAALYDWEGDEIQRVGKELALPPADWVHSLPPEEDLLCVGDGAQMYASLIRSLRPQARVIGGDNDILRSLCELGYRRYIRGAHATARELKARYVRPSDAKLPGTP